MSLVRLSFSLIAIIINSSSISSIRIITDNLLSGVKVIITITISKKRYHKISIYALVLGATRQYRVYNLERILQSQ